MSPQDWILKTFGLETMPVHIGHMMDRHQVYEIKGAILKVYTDMAYYKRAVGALRALEGTSDLWPKILFESPSHLAVYMTKLPGQVMDLLSHEDQTSLAYSLGQVHRQFHQCGGQANDLQVRSVYQAELTRNRRRAMRIIDDHSLFKQAFDEMTSLEGTLMTLDDLVLCHNDYSARNILVEGTHRICGVIDFELAFYNYRLADLAKTLFNLSLDHQESYIRGYLAQGDLDLSSPCLKYFLLAFGLEICSWAREKARPYYDHAYQTLEMILGGTYDTQIITSQGR